MADKLRHFLHVAGVQGISVAALSEVGHLEADYLPIRQRTGKSNC